MLKRCLDFSLAFLLIFLLSPVMLTVSVLVALKLGMPILFTQPRCGLHGSTFKLFKFRSMKNAYDANGKPLPDHERLTKLGKLLRSTSLDELPSLINVLKGDMSLVGPRPLLVEYIPLYTKEQFRRHEVKPGITGWAQINGRNAISWDEKFRLDVWYVDNHSLFLDIKILFITVKKVLIKEGISAENHVTMPFFTGKNDAEKK